MKKSLEFLNNKSEQIIKDWINSVFNEKDFDSKVQEFDIRKLCDELYEVLKSLLDLNDVEGIEINSLSNIKERLEQISKASANSGFLPKDINLILFLMKDSIIREVKLKYRDNLELQLSEINKFNNLIDKISIHIFEFYLKARENIIIRQQQDMLDLSTPVISIWDKILAVPLIGTLDSKRTQMAMEKILQMIVETESSIVIIDITGVPTVDTLIANYLLKTSSAIRLLGSELIITGISPSVAQTMVNLGVDLSAVITKAVLADGMKLALKKMS